MVRNILGAAEAMARNITAVVFAVETWWESEDRRDEEKREADG